MCIYSDMPRYPDRKAAEAAYFKYLDKHDKLVANAFSKYGKFLANLLKIDYNEFEENIKIHDASKREKQVEIDGYITNFYPYEGDGIELNEYGLRRSIYEKGLLSHYHNNPHHPEYWIFFGHEDRKLDCKPMDPIYIAEMLIDWIANERNDNLSITEYWKHNRGSKFLHIDTVDIIDEAVAKITEYRKSLESGTA